MSAALSRASAFQRAAADPGSSVFVTANAGSGKTKVLVDRIARLLLRGARPAAFLCVTYTKAAAAEMQRRLFERLGAWSVAEDGVLWADLAKLEGDERVAAAFDLRLARALFARALETPGGLKIQTIHAFCERLLARFPVEAGVAPGFEIADDAMSAALRARAAAAALKDPAVGLAFDRFAARFDPERLDRLLAALARAPSGNQEASAIRARHRASAPAEETRARILAELPWADYQYAALTLARSKSATDQDLAAAFKHAAACEGEAKWRAWTEIFFTKAGDLRKRIGTQAFRAAEPGLAKLLDDAASRAEEGAKRANRAARADEAIDASVLQQALARAYAAEKAQAGVLDFDDLIAESRALLTERTAAAWVLYKLDGGIDHILVDEGQDTSPSQWALIAPLRGEFFSGAGAQARSRTMFAVGDPKQSIYSFQGADPAQFLAEAQAVIAAGAAADIPVISPNLEMSFRSTPEVLAVVDAVFEGRDFGGDAIEGLNIVRHTAAREKECGLVELWPCAPRPEKVDAEAWDAPVDIVGEEAAVAKLARAIADAVRSWIAAGEAVWARDASGRAHLRAMHAGDVLILVRTRGPVFTQCLTALKRAGLPVAGADRLVLRDELAIEDLLAFARLALDPGDDLAVACALKSPLIGLLDDDAHLEPLAANRAPGERLVDRLAASTDPAHQAGAALIAGAIARASDHPYTFFSWLLETQDGTGRSGWARMFERLGPEARDPLEEMLARALNFAGTGAPTLQRFVHAIETDEAALKRELEEAGDAVRVMTVHGSKGLEAPVVILADTVAAPSSGGEEGLFATPFGPVLSTAKRGDDEVTAQARAASDAAAAKEHLRLLYVAMTRARDRLIIAGHLQGQGKGKRADGSWHIAVEEGFARLKAQGAQIETFATPFGEGLRLGQALKADNLDTENRKPEEIAALPAWAREPAPTETRLRARAPSTLARGPAFAPLGAGLARLRRGRLIHGLLERLPDAPLNTREAQARRWLAAQSETEAASADALIAEALAVIADPRFAAVFGPESRAEAPILAQGPGLPPGGVQGAIDRLVVTPTEALALDYKTDRPAPEDPARTPPAYLAQMAAYRAALRLIFPGRVVRCALLWTEIPRLMPLPDTLLDDYAPLKLASG